MSFAEEPAADEYVLAAELQAGSQVVIVNAAAGKAISNADSTAANNPERYRLGVDVAPADGKLSAPEAQIVWTVEVTDDGIAFKDAEGRYLSVPSGYNNLVLDSDCKYWTVSQAATADSVYLVSTTSAGGQGDLRGIEYYGGKFTTFYASETNIAANEAAFALQLYVRAESVEPPAGELSGKTIILHTNDTHGALMGFAQVAKVKADLEAQGATVLLVDAGDYSQGNPYVSLSKGETAITVMNAAGYDYATLGNHEFDYGWPQLRENLSKAAFQPIVADVIDEA
ncbi:MAG: metallophosphoesterase, partial [Oscillospiraceae bacterium]|nr:metallophosphoesterase [Oscillospiraceae bacterium]